VRSPSPSRLSQYWLRTELPTCMQSTHSRCQESSLADLTRVMEGPRARWAPEQFRQTKTPKLREAPG
jgi:hypothetical protein